MKKITFITMQLKTPGGIERFISTLAITLSQNYEVEIISNYGTKEDSLAFSMPKNIKITFLSSSQPKEVSLKNLILTFKWQKIPSELKRRKKIYHTKNQVFKNALKNLETDFIITDRAEHSLLVNKFYTGNAKKIATDHNFHQNNPKYIKTLLKSLKTFDALVVATKELYDFYKNKIGKTKCYLIPNPLPNIPQKKSPLNTKNLISIGRFVPEKDFVSLVETMKIIHTLDTNIHLTIIGDGVEMPHIKRLIKNYSLEKTISLPGFLTQPKIERYYLNSSLFVMTSKTEAFGLVLTEAMSYGLPCVAFSRASGARAQITKNTGVLINDSNKTALAKTIVKLLDSKSTLKEYQSNINQTIKKYSTEEISKLWNSLFSKI